MISFDGSVIVGPIGGVPAAVATLTTDPASRSAWVTMWVAEQFAVAVGASNAVSQRIEPVSATGSVTATPDIVTLPMFLTVIT